MNNWNWDKIIANVIKFAAVATAAPRWVGALLAAEGFIIPVAWLGWWVPASAILSAFMAVVEGLAFAYVFEAWRNQQDKDGDNLLYIAAFSAVTFVGVLAPYIAASVKAQPLSEILSGWGLGLWSVAVGLSTIAIVSSVGYAQKRKTTKLPNPALDTANNTITELRKQVKDTEHRANAAEQSAKFNEEQVRLANDALKDYSERATRAENIAGVTEQKLEKLSAEFAAVSEKFGVLAPMFAGDKQQRILAISQQWPNLTNKAIAELSESSVSYVSEVLTENSEPVTQIEHAPNTNGKAH